MKKAIISTALLLLSLAPAPAKQLVFLDPAPAKQLVFLDLVEESKENKESKAPKQEQQQEEEDLDLKYTEGLLPSGTPAPDFSIFCPKTGKKVFQLSEAGKGEASEGTWTLIDFWASWCPDCRREMPTVKEISSLFSGKVKVVGVSFDTDSTKLASYIEANAISWPQYCEHVKWKDTKISKQYNIKWLPTMYLIDPQGKVAFTTVMAKKMLDKLTSLDKEGHLIPAPKEQ